MDEEKKPPAAPEPRTYMFEWTGTDPGPSMVKFLADGLSIPGLEVLASFHSINSGQGWVLARASNSSAVYAAVADWSTVVNVMAHEVLDDAQITPTIQQLVKAHA